MKLHHFHQISWNLQQKAKFHQFQPQSRNLELVSRNNSQKELHQAPEMQKIIKFKKVTKFHNLAKKVTFTEFHEIYEKVGFSVFDLQNVVKTLC